MAVSVRLAPRGLKALAGLLLAVRAARVTASQERFVDVEPDFGIDEPLPQGDFVVPKVMLVDLLGHDGPARRASAAAEARTALSTLGAVAVVPQRVAPQHAAARKALHSWAQCLLPGGAGRAAAHVRPLAAGFVRRASISSQGLWAEGAEAQRELPRVCEEARGATEEMRAAVRRSVRALVAALDGEGHPAVLQREQGTASVSGSTEGLSLTQIVEQAEHLEHLHLYEEARNRASGHVRALDLHTDAGLMLAFVEPATPSEERRPYLEVEEPGGARREVAPLPEGAVVFFAGEATKWLRGTPHAAMRPMPHSLLLPAGFRWRAWYGVMLLLPEDVLISGGAAGKSLGTFGPMWRAARSHFAARQIGADVVRGSAAHVVAEAEEDQHHAGGQEAPVACGGGLVLSDEIGACPNGTISCWMTCMSIKGLEECHGTAWVPTGHGDLAELATAAPQCRDPAGKKWPEETGQMCPSCKPACTLSASAPAPSPVGGAFCHKMGDEGMVMYMQGFRWTSTSHDAECLAFFYGPWLLDQPWKLALACAATVAACAVMELVTLCRRRLADRRRTDVGLLLLLLQLALAYAAMLVVMMYSLELLISVLLGLLLGHALAMLIGRRLPKLSVATAGAAGVVAEAECECPSGSPCCRVDAVDGLSAPLLQPVAASASVEKKPVELQEVLLDVSGMTCNACSNTVEQALLAVTGVSAVKVALEAGTATVTLPQSAAPAALLSAVEAVGYTGAVRRPDGGGSGAEAAAPASAAPQ